MTVLVLITAASIGAFMLAFWLLGVVGSARAAIATANGAMATMRDPALDDLAREKAVQQAALRMIAQAGSLIGRCLVALAAAFVPILVADWAGLSPISETLAFMESWEVIVIASVLVTLLYVASIRLWPR